MKNKLVYGLLILALLTAQPLLAEASETVPDAAGHGSEREIPVDMSIEESYIVVIPEAVTIVPKVGSRDYSIGSVYLKEAHLYSGRSVNLSVPAQMDLNSTIDPDNTLKAASYLGSRGQGKKNQSRLSVDALVPVSISFEAHAFADAIAGNYEGSIHYRVWVEES